MLNSIQSLILSAPFKMQRNDFSIYNTFWLLLILTTITALGCSTSQPVVKEENPDKVDSAEVGEEDTKDEVNAIDYSELPSTPREFRGAWIATVDNIDWPSKPGLPVAKQKAELRAMLDRAELLNMNAIIFQVRPAADALYRSPYEPWSEYLTGKQGLPPEPFYDPLEFAIEEAHRRGLELHAWFNPFRAYHPSMDNKVAADHISNTHPEMVVEYGKYLWLNPGKESVRQYSVDVIADVVRRYDVDGVHLDDYFYPYPVKNRAGIETPFPDGEAFKISRKKGRQYARNEWRRENVNQFVKRLYQEIKLVDPTVRFGISPFGIWRPGHPEQIEGFDAYDRIYADARKWLQEGWVDYLSPQLYWPIDQKPQSFPVLMDWWEQQNIKGRHLWPGIYTSGLTTKSWVSKEIERQVRLIQQKGGATGAIHFSMKALMQNYEEVSGDLLMKEYRQPALVPASSWISSNAPAEPKVEIQSLADKYVITPKASSAVDSWLWVVKSKYGSQWSVQVYPGWKQTIALPQGNDKGEFKGAAISVVNKLGNESSSVIVTEQTIRRESKK